MGTFFGIDVLHSVGLLRLGVSVKLAADDELLLAPVLA